MYQFSFFYEITLFQKENEDFLQDPEQNERYEEDRNPTVARLDLLKRRILEIGKKIIIFTV
jgi:hypothetical protein